MAPLLLQAISQDEPLVEGQTVDDNKGQLLELFVSS